MTDLVKKAEEFAEKALGKSVSVPMRYYFPIISTSVLCTACMLSGGLTVGALKLFHKGPINQKTVLGAVTAVCTGTMLLGGAVLYGHSDNFAAPVVQVSDAAKEVAEGEFSVKVPEETGAFQVKELEDLRENFNKMTAQLSGMDYMRKDFMNSVSHEFKTPIAAISGFSELLEEDADHLSEEEKREYLELIREESNRLSKLCGNMLQLTRLDNTAIVTQKRNVQVDEQIRRAVILLMEKYPDRAEDFDLQMEPLTLETDPELLEEVWINLLDNAVKFSEPGDAIHIQSRGRQVTIADEGCGIAADKLPHIFEVFYQCDASHQKKGNGLGLPIVKRILSLLGGTISCTSEEGAGTKFSIQF